MPIPLLTFGSKQVKNLPLLNEIKKKLPYLNAEFSSNSLKLDIDDNYFYISSNDSETIRIGLQLLQELKKKVNDTMIMLDISSPVLH
jgi:hypothetical protein